MGNEIPQPLKLEHEGLQAELVNATMEPRCYRPLSRALLTSTTTGYFRPYAARVSHLPAAAFHPHGDAARRWETTKVAGKIGEAAKAVAKVLHAQTEEEVSYPTAIMIGEYLKLKLKM